MFATLRRSSADLAVKELISRLVLDEGLKTTVRDVLVDTLQDTDLFRATIKGILQAIPDSPLKSATATATPQSTRKNTVR